MIGSVTVACALCARLETITDLPVIGIAEWMRGTSIQDAMPSVSADDREVLITSTCKACLAKVYAGLTQ